MAKYTVTGSCNHEYVVQLFGKVKQREWILERKTGDLCPECEKKKRTEEIEKLQEDAIKKTEEYELPSLDGTEKQVLWANQIRISFIEYMEEKAGKTDKASLKTDIIEFCNFIIVNCKKASTWIDNRDTFMSLCEAFHKDFTNRDKKENDELISKEVYSESTVASLNGNGLIVTIKANEDKVEIISPKNQEVIDIAKSLQYKWSGSTWCLEITEFTGSYIDRAAEIGNKLLNVGFSITCLDKKVLDMAQSSAYEERCFNWVKFNTKTKKLALCWYKKNDKLYDIARSIPTAKWNSDSKNVNVNIENYADVEEFAEDFEFKFSSTAQEAIKQFVEAKNSIKTVSPQEHPEKVDKLQEILQSSDEILDDLLDD